MRIKGHAKIELTDVYTGKKEVIEHDNIVTNAVSRLLSSWSKLWGYSKVNTYLLPIITKAMGGIYLFDNSLTEDVNHYLLPNPATAALTGYAGNVTSDGSDTMRGDFNETESGEIANGYKYVWDFGTDDANGTIAAVVLTNDIAGYHGYHYEPRLAISNANTQQGNGSSDFKGLGYGDFPSINPPTDFAGLVSMDVANNEYICIIKTSTTNINIITYEAKMDTLGLNDKIQTFEIKDVESITISDTVQTDTDVCFIDGEDGYYYGIKAYGSGYTVSKLSKSDHTYTIAIKTVFNDSDVIFISCGTGANFYRPVIRNGYLYMYASVSSTSTSITSKIIKIDIASPANFTILQNSEYTTNHPSSYCYLTYYMYKAPNNIIYTNGYIIDNNDHLYENGMEYTTGYYYTGLNAIVDDLYISYCYYHKAYDTTQYNYFIPNLQYLATINNLDSPVMKTADKTMKITYTLTYASE